MKSLKCLIKAIFTHHHFLETHPVCCLYWLRVYPHYWYLVFHIRGVFFFYKQSVNDTDEASIKSIYLVSRTIHAQALCEQKPSFLMDTQEYFEKKKY